MNRLRALVAGSALITAAGVAVVSPAPAGAAPPSLKAWWSQAQQLPSPVPVAVPAPPNVPPGGLYVANTPGGPGAVSALRFASETPSPGILKLHVDANSAPFSSIALIQACLPLGDWPPEENGPWAHVPLYTCAGVKPTLAADGTTMEWPIPDSFQSDDTDHFDVLLVPDPAANPFQIAFSPPDGDAFTQEEAASPAPPPVDQPAPFDYGSTVSTGTVPLPSDTNFGALAPSVPAPVAPTRPAARRIRTPLDRVPRPAAAVHDSDRRQRLEATLMLFVLAAAWFWLAGEPSRVPRLLGSVGGGGTRRPSIALEAAHRGIGRFARPRTGRAPKLG